MLFGPAEYTSAAGIQFTVRSAAPEDAGAIAEFIKVMSTETEFLPWEYVEGMRSPEYVRGYIDQFSSDPRRMAITAWKGEDLIALYELTNFGNEKPVRHRCIIVPGVRRAYWGTGVAKTLFEVLISEAIRLGYEQVEGNVDCDNRRSYGLVHKLGYMDYGICPRHDKLEDGSYHDVCRVIKWLDPEVEKLERERISTAKV